MRPAQLRAAPTRRIYTCSAPQRRQIQTSQCFTDAPRPSQAEVERARAYCASLVRTYDTPSHVLQSFIPQSSRDAYLAIRAFNVDVARVADTTSTPTVGMMRMQFWRDTPVAILLAHAAEDLFHRSDGKSRLSKNWFHRIINTREHALETYAENTYSTLLYLTLSALPQASITTDHIASHIGKASGIATVLRGIPLMAFPHPQPGGTAGHITGQSGPTQGAVLLPLDVMAEANVREEDVFRQGGAAPGLKDAVFTVATRANDHLITAREMLSKLRSEGSLGHDFEHADDGEHEYTVQQMTAGTDQQLRHVDAAFGVFMSSTSTQSWLDRLQKADFDLFDPQLRKSDWKLPAKAYWAYTRRKI
ncbi:hypothetical protein EJ07DRAFT_168039 [Lizonia empirigonia]|nr:hypothetical protein EJ07DRAFT_168039 [Lizonia empirigonia]